MRNRISKFLVGIGGFVALSGFSLGCEVVHEKSGEWPEPNGVNQIKTCEGDDYHCTLRKAYANKKYGESYRQAAAVNREFQKQYGYQVSHGHGEDMEPEGEVIEDNLPADAAPAGEPAGDGPTDDAPAEGGE